MSNDSPRSLINNSPEYQRFMSALVDAPAYEYGVMVTYKGTLNLLMRFATHRECIQWLAGSRTPEKYTIARRAMTTNALWRTDWQED